MVVTFFVKDTLTPWLTVQLGLFSEEKLFRNLSQLRGIMLSPARPAVPRTPFTLSQDITARLGNNFCLTHDDMQLGNAVNYRAAYNIVWTLTPSPPPEIILTIDTLSSAAQEVIAAFHTVCPVFATLYKPTVSSRSLTPRGLQ